MRVNCTNPTFSVNLSFCNDVLVGGVLGLLDTLNIGQRDFAQ